MYILLFVFLEEYEMNFEMMKAGHYLPSHEMRDIPGINKIIEVKSFLIPYMYILLSVFLEQYKINFETMKTDHYLPSHEMRERDSW